MNIKNRFVSKHYVRISPKRRIEIATRTFRVSKTQRSKRHKQLLIPIYHSHIHQIGFRIVSKPGGRKRKSKKPAVIISRIQKQAFAPAVFILIGAIGIAFFATQATQGKSIEAPNTFGSNKQLNLKRTASKPKEPAKPKYLPKSDPTHITVASVGIDAPVTPVGKDETGGIQMPPTFDWTTGWYSGSPSPGQKGPAIIVGHVDTYKGISVFWKLREVKPGDEISIARADGKTVKYKVTELKQFEQANFPTKEVYGNIDHAGLRLITCGGSFNKATESYSQNTVVYADMVT